MAYNETLYERTTMFNMPAIEAATQTYIAEMKEAHEEKIRHRRKMQIVRVCSLAATFAAGFLAAQ